MHQFHEAVEARDPARMAALLAPGVVFTSPVAFGPYPGRAVTAAILETVMEVFEDFHYVRAISNADGRDHALIFEARIGDRQLTGCDFLHLDDAGLIDDFMVMVRPLSGAQALAAAMGERWDLIQQRAMAWAGADQADA